jgi:L-threonylcarbamoyladenylate synthase
VTMLWHWGDPLGPLLETLRRGGILAIPTESSYGLGVDPRSETGVETIYRIKGRERGKPLPLVVADQVQLAALGVVWDDHLLPLAECWPGPLTLVLPLKGPLPAAAGADTVAVRVPGHARLRGLLAELGTGLTATSANRSGEPPELEPRQVASLLAGHDAVVIDDGPLPGGPPSTVVAWREGRLEVLRRGRLAAEELERRLARALSFPQRLWKSLWMGKAGPQPSGAW